LTALAARHQAQRVEVGEKIVVVLWGETGEALGYGYQLSAAEKSMALILGDNKEPGGVG
jgi:hypothetical protein